jgi:hypothetical protein
MERTKKGKQWWNKKRDTAGKTPHFILSFLHHSSYYSSDSLPIRKGLRMSDSLRSLLVLHVHLNLGHLSYPRFVQELQRLTADSSHRKLNQYTPVCLHLGPGPYFPCNSHVHGASGFQRPKNSLLVKLRSIFVCQSSKNDVSLLVFTIHPVFSASRNAYSPDTTAL